MDIDEKLSELFNEEFFNVLNIICGELNKKDSNYVRVINKSIDILDQNKRLMLVCDRKKAVPLSKNDVKSLIKYMEYDEEENLIYQRSLLYTGFRIAYMIFNNAGMLKSK